MAYGLQIRNASGAIVVSTETRLIRLNSTYSIPALSRQNVGTYYVLITLAGIVNNGAWAVITTGNYVVSTIQAGSFYVWNHDPFKSAPASTAYVIEI